MVKLSGLPDESFCCILIGLQFGHQTTSDTGNEAVALVESTANELGMPDSPELTQLKHAVTIFN